MVTIDHEIHQTTEPRWNLVQVVAWIAFRLPWVVAHFSQRRTRVLPPTLHQLYAGAASLEAHQPVATVEHRGETVPIRGRETNQMISDASGDLIIQLSAGRLTATGLRNGAGDPEAVPSTHWPYLEFHDQDQNHPLGAAPRNPGHARVTKWTHLTFDREEVLAIWGAPTVPDPYRSGLQGRPTIRHLILAQFRDRAAAGQCEAKLAEEARVLHQWATDTHPRAPAPTARTIENFIRKDYRVYKAARDSSNTPHN